MKYIYRVLDCMAWFWFMEWLILVCIRNRIIHGRLEIWSLSSRVHIRYLTRSLRSLVRYRCEHSKINSISPPVRVLFSIYYFICLSRQVICLFHPSRLANWNLLCLPCWAINLFYSPCWTNYNSVCVPWCH